LTPVQVRILNVTDQQLDYCKQLEDRLREAGLRAHLDARNEKLGYKIRDGQMHKVPYMLIIGDKEREAQTVSLRLRNGQNVNGLSLDEFLTTIKKEITQRDLKSPWWDENFKAK